MFFELDTYFIIKRVKEVFIDNNLGIGGGNSGVVFCLGRFYLRTVFTVGFRVLGSSL